MITQLEVARINGAGALLPETEGLLFVTNHRLLFGKEVDAAANGRRRAGTSSSQTGSFELAFETPIAAVLSLTAQTTPGWGNHCT